MVRSLFEAYLSCLHFANTLSNNFDAFWFLDWTKTGVKRMKCRQCKTNAARIYLLRTEFITYKLTLFSSQLSTHKKCFNIVPFLIEHKKTCRYDLFLTISIIIAAKTFVMLETKMKSFWNGWYQFIVTVRRYKDPWSRLYHRGFDKITLTDLLTKGVCPKNAQVISFH